MIPKKDISVEQFSSSEIDTLLDKIALYFEKNGEQIITTQTPDDSQLEVAISALKNAFGDRLSEYEGKEFNADAIG